MHIFPPFVDTFLFSLLYLSHHLWAGYMKLKRKQKKNATENSPDNFWGALSDLLCILQLSGFIPFPLC